MSKWEMAKVGEVFSLIRNGASIKQGIIPGGYPITRIETIANSEVDRNRMGYAGITDIAKYDNYVLQTGDILMSHINSEKHLGKTAYYEKEQDEIVIHGMNLLCLRPIKAVIDYKYAYYFFQSNVFKHQIPNITKKSVNQASFTVSALKKLTLPLPSIKNQQQIAKTLDTAAELLTMRKQQLTELDNLTKSIFYEMFGDPVTNEKGWGVKKLKDLSLLITKGSSPTWQGVEYTNDTSQVLFITSENVREGYLDLSKRKYLENKFNELQKRSILEYGDLLINIVGASIGRAALFYSTEVANINQAVALVRCKKDVCLNYLCYYLNSPKALQMYNEMQVDVARANLSLKNIGDLAVIYPPIALQSQFAEIVTKIEEQKALVQKAIDETQYLFDSLMSGYFD